MTSVYYLVLNLVLMVQLMENVYLVLILALNVMEILINVLIAYLDINFMKIMNVKWFVYILVKHVPLLQNV